MTDLFTDDDVEEMARMMQPILWLTRTANAYKHSPHMLKNEQESCRKEARGALTAAAPAIAARARDAERQRCAEIAKKYAAKECWLELPKDTPAMTPVELYNFGSADTSMWIEQEILAPGTDKKEV